MKQHPNDSKKTPTDLFIVEGLGVVEDFLRHSSQRIVQVGCNQRGRSFVDKLSQSHQFKRASEHSQVSRSPVWAEVRISILTDLELYQEIAGSGKKPSLMLATDHVTDPRNLGAIVRNAAFFGVPYLIVSKDRQAQLTQAVVSTSQGGFACATLVVVTNMNRTLKTLKEMGFWVLGADMKGEAVQGVRGFYEHACLVMGSEDKGLSQQTKRCCDRLVAIKPPVSQLNSLNVSVAAGILLSHLV